MRSFGPVLGRGADAPQTSGTLKCDLFVVVIVSESISKRHCLSCLSRRSGEGQSNFSDDRVDCAATVGHHDHELNDSTRQPGPRGNGHVQIDCRSACAIRIQAVGAGLTRGEYKPRRRIAVSGIGDTSGYDKIPLRELASAVEVSNGYPFARDSVLWVLPSGLGEYALIVQP